MGVGGLLIKQKPNQGLPGGAQGRTGKIPVGIAGYIFCIDNFQVTILVKLIHTGCLRIIFDLYQKR